MAQVNLGYLIDNGRVSSRGLEPHAVAMSF
jgi:hypothetical protein